LYRCYIFFRLEGQKNSSNNMLMEAGGQEQVEGQLLRQLNSLTRTETVTEMKIRFK